MHTMCSPNCLKDFCVECESPANSPENTPGSSSTATVNLSREFTLALQTRSYEEICTKIHLQDPNQHLQQEQQHHGNWRDLNVSELLQPSKERVEEAIGAGGDKLASLSGLVNSHFDHSENATNLCVGLFLRVQRARDLYKPLGDFLRLLPDDLDDLTESQCDNAYDIFAQFDSLENPIQCSDSQQFQEMRHRFTELQQQLHDGLRKSRSRVSLLRRVATGSAVCLIGTVVTVVASAAIIASHAFVTVLALASSPLCLNPRNFKKKELRQISQLDAAAKGAFVLINHLATIDSLVTCLQLDIDDTKNLIHLVLKRGRDIYHIKKVLQQLQKDNSEFTSHLENLEKHICLCFIYVNEARSILLQQID